MNEQLTNAQFINHLMDEAARKYSASSFTIFANPRHGSTGITFPVPYDTSGRIHRRET